jgi:GTP-binding protein
MELMVCDVPESAVGVVTERLGPRKGRMMDMTALGSGRTRLTFRIPARGLVGFRSEFLTITRGEGIMSSQFDGYEPWFGDIPKRSNGAIISDRQGDTVPYALFSIQERGSLFVGPGVQVYQGMIIGENAHPSGPERQRLPGEEAHQHPRRWLAARGTILTPPGRCPWRRRWSGSPPTSWWRSPPASVRMREADAGHRRPLQGRPGPEARPAGLLGLTGATRRSWRDRFRGQCRPGPASCHLEGRDGGRDRWCQCGSCVRWS